MRASAPARRDVLSPEARPDGDAAVASDRQAVRVLFVVDGWYPGYGGAERQVELLTEALSDHHQVEVWAPLLGPRLKRHRQVRGVRLHHIAYPRVRFLGALVLVARFAARLLRQRKRFDAIHVHMVKNLATVLGLMSPWLRARTVAKVSGAWEFDGGVLDPRARRKPWIRVMNACIRRLDVFQTISEETRRKLIEAGYPEARIAMIPNAVDGRHFSPLPEKNHAGPPLAIYAGRFTEVKGVHHLIEAWGIMHRSLPGGAPRLLLLGRGVLGERLRARVAALDLADRVEFGGFQDDISRQLAEADLCVQPSLQEGLPNTVLQAMACGLPVIATRVSGNLDLVRPDENGYLVAPGDPQGLADAVRRFLELPAAKRVAMGRSSRLLIEQEYQLPAVLDRLLEVYRGEKAT